jgi:hypothetical protein
MKKRMNLLVVVALCAIVTTLSSCNKEASDESKGSVKFSMGLSSQLKSLSIADSSGTTDSTTSYYAIVTITDVSGQEVYSSKKLSIYTFGGSYISESLTLETGEYKLTEFVVVKGQDAVYATPVAGSEKAAIVDQPLPILFNVTDKGTTQVQPEVLQTTDIDPQEFGYSSFGFTVIETMFFDIITYRTTADTSSADSTIAISSSLYILVSSYNDSTSSDTTNIDYRTLNYQLKPQINTIEVNKATSYKLSVTKNGYTGWSKDYSREELNAFKSNPLKVYLKEVVIGDSIKNNN